MKKKIGSALVVGAGIGGIRSALDLAEFGYRVTLIDKAPQLGGTLRQLDYQFPGDGCGMCKMLPLVERDAGSQFCLRKGLFHENLEIMLSTELVALEGDPGRFQVTLRQRPSMVDPEHCLGCGECSRVCPVEVPDEFNAGLTPRKAVYLPVPHAIPNHYTVDVASCTRCGACETACPTGAIDLGREARRGFRILVVDDDRMVRDSLKDRLEQHGFQADTAESGAKALECLAGQTYRLMLLDIKMPGMDGVEVLKRTKEMRPELSVVMTTAQATVETAVQAIEMGALDYLMKPFDPDTLVPLVVKMCERIERRMEVGAVVLSAGFASFDPAAAPRTYGYRQLPNVVTSLEFERLISGTGPTGGRLVRPSDGKEVRKAAWLQCVGSRDLAAGADYCSSICCMFAIKEALLAKERSNGQIEATIFYMDMRTFGKNFQRYRDRAEKEYGVRFRRSRIRAVEPAGTGGDLRLSYMDVSGRAHDETFDLVVLATGQRPPATADDLAEMTGVTVNPWGFCEVRDSSLSRTAREGVFVGGSFSEPRDISESVIQASSAAAGASRIINSRGGGLAVEPGPKVEFRDVSREPPLAALALCTCGGRLLEAADLEEIAERLRGGGTVGEMHQIERLCTRAGWEELEQRLRHSQANRVVIGACLPYVYTRKLRELGEKIGLRPTLMEVVDIRTPAFPGRTANREEVSAAVRTALAMGVGRLKGMEPGPAPSAKVTQKALVVGGGIAGMTAALVIADHGFDVSLVEQAAELGGNLRSLRRTLNGGSPQDLLKEVVAKVEKHPKLHLYRRARVLHSQGRVGSFSTTIEKENGQEETVEHGVTVLATGGRERRTEAYCYEQSDAIVTQHELEEKLHNGTLNPVDLRVVAMIQCVDSREEPRNYCSRICCSSALKHALYLKELNPAVDVYIFYRDLMAYGFLEPFYTRAREQGVTFIQYEVGHKPQVTVDQGRPLVRAVDPILGREVMVRPDVLVLSTGIEPGDQQRLAEIFGVGTDRDGFFQEAESKWRPVDFLKEGVFMCGIAHSPRSVPESVAMAEAAAQRALRILGSEELVAGSTVADVRPGLCALCELCISACPYGARWRDEEEERIVVDELMCQGCGSCAAVCPNSASVLRGYRDQQVFSVIDAALDGVF